MKHLIYTAILLVAVLGVTRCKKPNTQPAYPVAAALQSGFYFKAGSYWIYVDSTTHEEDSAYVMSDETLNVSQVCVGGGPQYTEMLVGIRVIDLPSQNTEDYEAWRLIMLDSAVNLEVQNTRDSLDELAGNMTLAKYPYSMGAYNQRLGCVGWVDSANVTAINSALTINGQTFTNILVSAHANIAFASNNVYTNTFYVSPGVGVVKAVFNHPAEAVYRVLELQRYKIVQ